VSIGQILEQKSSKKGVTWCPSIFLRQHSYYDICKWDASCLPILQLIKPSGQSIRSTTGPMRSPQLRFSDISNNCSYFHHASSSCHNVSFELVEYYCGCMSDLHNSSWLMFAASGFQSLKLWSSLQDTIASHRPLPAGWNPRLYCNRKSLKLLPPCIQPIDQE
jgi:hypothetical protein